MRRLSLALLAVWAAVVLAVPWFAPDLQRRVLGFPIAYWLAAQGAPLLFLAIIVAYVRGAERLDAEFERERQQAEPADG